MYMGVPVMRLSGRQSSLLTAWQHPKSMAVTRSSPLGLEGSSRWAMEGYRLRRTKLAGLMSP